MLGPQAPSEPFFDVGAPANHQKFLDPAGEKMANLSDCVCCVGRLWAPFLWGLGPLRPLRVNDQQGRGGEGSSKIFFRTRASRQVGFVG